MSQFPVLTDSGIKEAVNYLASGPSGLGQSFHSFASSEDAYLTGNYRKPYTQSGPADLYVPAVAISQAEMLDTLTFKYTFATTQTSPPFALGSGPRISGFTNPLYNAIVDNDNLYQIGVVECTNDYFILRSITAYPTQAPETASASGFVYSTAKNVGDDPFNKNNTVSNDCEVRFVVNGATDQVAVAGQMTVTLNYEATVNTTFYVFIEIDRYIGSINSDPVNPDFVFNYDATIAYKQFSFDITAGTGTLPTIEQIFSTIIDNPVPGYYRYFLNITLGSTAANLEDAQFTTGVIGLRAISAQVVKQ